MSGVLELLPAEQITFQHMLDTIRREFERFGYLPIQTPIMELTEVLLTKSGGETEREVFFAQTTGSMERDRTPDLALRFDLTVPTARYVAEHEHELSFPFRRYQIQQVYRGERPQRGRFREFYQCDIDVIGRDTLDLHYDAEIPAVIERVFNQLAIGPFTIRLNNRKILHGLLKDLGIESEETRMLAMREIDKLERRGPEAVSESLSALGVADPARLIDAVRSRSTDHASAVAMLDELMGGGALLVEGVSELRRVIETMRGLGVPEQRYVVDLSIARGLDYYTGTVYETTLDEHPEIGSICSGGRYDDLAGHYTSSRLPGVGMSIGFTRLFWQLREVGIVGASASSVEVLVTLMDPEALDYSLDIAQRLRRAGVNTEAVVEPSKLGKQMKYANKARIRFTVIAGSDERARGTAMVKDLNTQTQQEVAVGEIATHILSMQEQ